MQLSRGSSKSKQNKAGMESQIKSLKAKKRGNRKDFSTPWALPQLAGRTFLRWLLITGQGNLYQARKYFTDEQTQAI